MDRQIELQELKNSICSVLYPKHCDSHFNDCRECIASSLISKGWGDINKFSEELEKAIRDLLDTPFEGKTGKQSYIREGMEEGLIMALDIIKGIREGNYYND